MNDKRTVSTIDLALQKHDTPVGPLFVAVRHGRIKKCFTRDTAIRYLAFFMTTEAFSVQVRAASPGCAAVAMTEEVGETGNKG
jgi:hypothetical protein